MSFFPEPAKQKKHRGRMKADDIRVYRQLGCDACPLAKLRNRNPSMEPTGSTEPTIYILGGAPYGEDDIRGRQFTGRAGEVLRKILRDVIGFDYKEITRFNNVVRTRCHEHGSDTKPPWEAIEACRPSIIADIEETKPKAIFGLGNLPLEWVADVSGIYAWRGRYTAVRIGSHVCWYFPLVHPSDVLEGGTRYDDEGEGLKEGKYLNEDHRILKLDIERAWKKINELGTPIIHTPEHARAGLEIIETCDAKALTIIEKRLNHFGQQPVIGIDYETTALRPYNAKAIVLSAAVSDGANTLSIPFLHPSAEWSNRDYKKLCEIWTDFLRNAKAIKAVHNLQFELEWTVVNFGYDLAHAGQWECTQVQASIIDHRYKGSEPGPLSLDFLVRQHFGLNLKALSNVDRANLINTPLPIVLEYNALDAKYHCLLYKRQHAIIMKEKLITAYKFARRRVPAIVLAQVKGIPTSQKRAKKLLKKYSERIADIENQIAKDRSVKKFEAKYGTIFNPGSNPDCVKLFYTMLGRKECEVYDKSKKNVKPWYGGVDGNTRVNKISCDKEVLTQLEHPLADKIIALRKPQKLLSTYVLPLMQGTDESKVYEDGKLHPIFNHTFTDTGRLSGEEPNMQNFPKRQDEAKEVRQLIKPPPGHVVLSIDYGQIEARVIAMYTKDKRFCKALWERYDVHGEWAERIAYEYPTRVGGKKMLKDKKAMKDFRTDIKNQWTFPLFFGAQLPSVAKYLHIPEEVLKPLYDQFWSEFDGIRAWQEGLVEFYEKHGYVETYTGRRRYGPMNVNKIINSPVQGFTCEFVLDGMCRLSETGDPILQPEIQIHDDLTWVAVPVDKVDYVAEKALEILLNPAPEFKDFICVPITLEMGVGDDWLSVEEIGVFSSDDK